MTNFDQLEEEEIAKRQMYDDNNFDPLSEEVNAVPDANADGAPGAGGRMESTAVEAGVKNDSSNPVRRRYRTEEEMRADEHARFMAAHQRAMDRRAAWIASEPMSVPPAVRAAANQHIADAEAARRFDMSQETARVVEAEKAAAAQAKWDSALQGKLADAEAKVAAAREAGAARIGAAETRERGAQARADAKNATTLEQQRMRNEQARETEAERSRREAEKIAAQQQMERDRLEVKKASEAGRNYASMKNSERAAIARIVSATMLAYPGDYKMAAQSLKQYGLSDEDIKAALEDANKYAPVK